MVFRISTTLLMAGLAYLAGTSDSFPSPSLPSSSSLGSAGGARSSTAMGFAASEAVAGLPEVADAPAAGAAENPCGEGFYPARGVHGDVCVFDYAAAGPLVSGGRRREMEEGNRARARRGLAPLTARQYFVLRSQVDGMQARVKAMHAAARKVVDVAGRPSPPRENGRRRRSGGAMLSVLKSFSDGLFEDTCDSNDDCRRPEVCCDFGIKKMCCDGAGR